MSPFPQFMRVTDLPRSVPDVGDEWMDAAGRVWRPGEITADGAIVGPPGNFYTAGIVWVSRDKLDEAGKWGWRATPLNTDALIAVER